jgi:hypothetical protein
LEFQSSTPRSRDSEPKSRDARPFSREAQREYRGLVALSRNSGSVSRSFAPRTENSGSFNRSFGPRTRNLPSKIPPCALEFPVFALKTLDSLPRSRVCGRHSVRRAQDLRGAGGDFNTKNTKATKPPRVLAAGGGGGFRLLASGFRPQDSRLTSFFPGCFNFSSKETTALGCAPEGGSAAGRGFVGHAAHFLLGRHEEWAWKGNGHGWT